VLQNSYSLIATLKNVPKKSAVATAIRYALSRWEALVRYRDDGRIEIDNAVERTLHAVALGRKNYLFAGSDAGGDRRTFDQPDRRTAALESLLATSSSTARRLICRRRSARYRRSGLGRTAREIAMQLAHQDRRVSAALRRLAVRLKKRLGFSIAMAWICCSDTPSCFR
jgi:hypothetical protein